MRKTAWVMTAMMLAATLTGCQAKVQAKKSDIQSVADLSGKTVACQSGTTGYSMASQIEGITIKEYPTSIETFGTLIGHTSDAAVMDKDVAVNLVNNAKEKHPNVYILDEPLAEEEYAIAYRKGNDELGAELNKALEELQADGTIASINAHWIGDEADKQPYIPAQASTSGEKLRMATNAAFPPFESCGTDVNDIQGIDIDIMRAICSKLDKELVIVNMEFESILGSVESGAVDVGVAAITVTDERKERVDFTNSYAATSQVVIVNGD